MLRDGYYSKRLISTSKLCSWKFVPFNHTQTLKFNSKLNQWLCLHYCRLKLSLWILGNKDVLFNRFTIRNFFLFLRGLFVFVIIMFDSSVINVFSYWVNLPLEMVYNYISESAVTAVSMAKLTTYDYV